MEHTATTARRIGFDARYLSHDLIGGVRTYVHDLLVALCGVASDREWVLYADAKAPFELNVLPPSARVRTIPWRNGASSVANDLRLGAIMRRDGVAVAHTPANYGFTPAALPLVVTLHDAINLLPLREVLRDDSKRPRHILVMAYLHLLTVAAMRRRPFVITVSQYSRREILRRAPLPPDRVHVVHSACDAAFRPLDPGSLRERRDRWRLRPRVLLADAIKNPACVLRAYRALPSAVRQETSLVFFARRPPSQIVQDSVGEGECLLVLRPPREDLIALYNLADLFVFPSWYEGFGLPALEAMACGTPVIASSRGSLPEIVGDGGYIVDAEEYAAIAGHVVRHLAGEDSSARLRRAALAQAARFSWEQTARKTVDIYDEAFRCAAAKSRCPRPRARGGFRSGK